MSVCPPTPHPRPLTRLRSSAERFVVLDHAHRSLVQAQPLEEGAGSGAGPYEHCFNLTLLENHQGRTVEKLLKAPSQSVSTPPPTAPPPPHSLKKTGFTASLHQVGRAQVDGGLPQPHQPGQGG